jgi:hypothetical protein
VRGFEEGGLFWVGGGGGAVPNFQYGLSTGYSQSREERTTKHSHSKKKKRKCKRGYACSDSGKERMKHK